ncbi:MAG TPA: TIGR01777 family oxidoreductase [Pseudonocardiaceae bacterium]|nr:TIGR01777 family oxidoreductase [Pseudonocardiaceae bacterium]
MHIVVAGSSGLIGTALVVELRGAGHEVTRLVRRAPAGPDERRWDPPAARIADDALAGADAVINLCGAGLADRRWTAARKQALRDSRNAPTEVLAAAVADRGIPVLVNASAVGYYGDTGDQVVTEDAPNGAGFLAEICRDWEQATGAAQRAGARVVRLRSGIVLAKHGGLLGRLRPLFSLLLGGKLGDGKQYMPWIALPDEVAAIRFAVEQDAVSGPLNLTAPEPVTNAEFTKEFGAALGRPAVWTAPGFGLRLLMGELADEGVLAGQRAVPAALQAAGFEFRFPGLRTTLAVATQR